MTYSARTRISLALILVVSADLKNVPSQQKLHCKQALENVSYMLPCSYFIPLDALSAVC